MTSVVDYIAFWGVDAWLGPDHRLSVPHPKECPLLDDEPTLRTPSLLHRLIHHHFQLLARAFSLQNLVFHQAAHSLSVEGGIA